VVEFAAHWIVSGALLLVVANAVRGFHVEGALAALLAALVLGLVNGLVKPLVVILTLPLTILTFGLFYLVVNALMMKLTAAAVPGFDIDGFWPAIWGALLLALLNVLVAWVAGPGW
jgi:putative membrane protein